MKFSVRSVFAVAAIAALAAFAAGCGSSNTSTTKVANASATQSTSAAMSAATITTKDAGSVGTILAGDQSRTVYLFEADKGSTPTCNGACAAAWPPVLTSGSPTASGSAKSNKLGTTKRADGKTQVTYAGHPVYYFMKDAGTGDVFGQGVDAFGGEWYVMSPSGSKVEGSANKDKQSADSSSSNSSSSSSSGYGGY